MGVYRGRKGLIWGPRPVKRKRMIKGERITKTGTLRKKLQSKVQTVGTMSLEKKDSQDTGETRIFKSEGGRGETLFTWKTPKRNGQSTKTGNSRTKGKAKGHRSEEGTSTRN